MHDITLRALNRAWRTGFGTIVPRQDARADMTWDWRVRLFRRLAPSARERR